MWHQIKDKLPKTGKYYPVWVVSNHSGHEFHEYALLSGSLWWIKGQTLEQKGWTLVAWYDLSNYR